MRADRPRGIPSALECAAQNAAGAFDEFSQPEALEAPAGDDVGEHADGAGFDEACVPRLRVLLVGGDPCIAQGVAGTGASISTLSGTLSVAMPSDPFSRIESSFCSSTSCEPSQNLMHPFWRRAVSVAGLSTGLARARIWFVL